MTDLDATLINNSQAYQHLFRGPEIYPIIPVQFLNGNQSYMPLKQGQAMLHKYPIENTTIFTTPYTNVPSSINISTDLKINSQTIHNHVEKLQLEWSLLSTSEAVAMPAAYQIDYIHWILPNGNKIQIVYGEDNLYLDYIMKTSKADWITRARMLNAPDDYYNPGGDPSKIYANREKRFVVELDGIWYAVSDWFGPALKGEHTLKVYWKPSSYWLISGTNTDITMTSLNLVVNTNVRLDSVNRFQLDKYSNNNLNVRYINTVAVDYIQTFAPSTTYTINLTGFTGLFTSLNMFIRDNGAVGRALLKYYLLYEFQINNQSNQNMINEPMEFDNIQNIYYLDNHENDVTQFLNVYRFDCGDTSKSVSDGIVTGYIALTGKETLKITTMPAVVNKVVSWAKVDTTLTTDAGYFRVRYKDFFTNAIAFDATASTIKTRIETDLPPFAYSATTVTISGVLPVTSGTITCTINRPLEYIDRDELLYIDPINLNDGGVPSGVFNSSITTYHKRGFPASGTYCLHIWGHQINSLEIGSDGSFTQIN